MSPWVKVKKDDISSYRHLLHDFKHHHPTPTAASDWSFGNVLLPIDGNNRSSMDYFVQLSTAGVPFLERILFKLLTKSSMVSEIIIKGNNVSIERTERAREIIEDEFGRLDTMLLKNEGGVGGSGMGKYLLGTAQPTAADITLAALSVPLVMPDEARHAFGDMQAMETFIESQENGNPRSVSGLREILNLSKKLRKTKTGKHVLGLYHTIRFNSAMLSPTSTSNGT